MFDRELVVDRLKKGEARQAAQLQHMLSRHTVAVHGDVSQLGVRRRGEVPKD
jgi:hypothetical protein